MERKSHIIIASTNIKLGVFILFSPYIALIFIGYMNFGVEFFSFEHFTKKHGTFVNPYVGAFSICVAATISGRKLHQLIRSGGDFLSIDLNKLIYLNSINYDIEGIDFQSFEIIGVGNNVFSFKYFGKIVKMPLFFACESPKEILKSVKAALQLELR